MTISIIEDFGTDISNRRGASKLREILLEAVNRDGSIELDFTGVRTLSDSFADELFAVLVAQKGEDWFRQHVKISNLSSTVRQSILEAVQDRLSARV